jgi:hypothetical protein
VRSQNGSTDWLLNLVPTLRLGNLLVLEAPLPVSHHASSEEAELPTPGMPKLELGHEEKVRSEMTAGHCGL